MDNKPVDNRDIRQRIKDGDYEVNAAARVSAASRREMRIKRRHAFQYQLETENGIPHEIAFAGIFTKAWEDRSSIGLEAVVEYYEELCTTIVDPIMQAMKASNKR